MKKVLYKIFLFMFLGDALLGIFSGTCGLSGFLINSLPAYKAFGGVYTITLLILAVIILIQAIRYKMKISIIVVSLYPLAYFSIGQVIAGIAIGIIASSQNINIQEAQSIFTESSFLYGFGLLVGAIQLLLSIWVLFDIRNGPYRFTPPPTPVNNNPDR